MGVEDVIRAYTLFLDVLRSTQFMMDNADQVTSFVVISLCCMFMHLQWGLVLLGAGSSGAKTVRIMCTDVSLQV